MAFSTSITGIGWGAAEANQVRFLLGNGFRRAALISSVEGGLDGRLVEPRQILPKDDLNAQLSKMSE